MRRVSVVGCAVIAALGLLSGAATAQTPDRTADDAAADPTAAAARALYMNARFREAGNAFEGVLLRRDLDVSTAAEAHVHLAVLRFMVGEPERARAHAEAAVALVPDVVVPEGAPREALAMVDRARAQLGGPSRLRVGSDDPVAATGSRRVRARLDPSPGGLPLELTLRCAAADLAPADARGPAPEVEVSVPSDRAVRCEAAARTPGGAALFEAHRELLPAAALAPDGEDPTGDAPWLWIGVSAGVAVAAGIAIAVLATSSSGQPVISATEIDAEGW